jgi:hypothetical protein
MPTKNRNTPAPRKRTRDDGGADTDSSATRSRASSSIKAKDRSKRQGRISPGAYQQLVYGGSVLVVAIVASVLWNALDSSTDPRIALKFWPQICRVAHCARFVRPVRRTLEAARPIRPGEILAEIPRVLQIWDLDALRDDFVQTELLSARHKITGNRLPSGAFLAAYLALQFHQLQQESSELKNSTTTMEEIPLDPLRKAYFHALPSPEELSDHPLFWTMEETAELLGRTSVSFGVAFAYKEMVASEYQALVSASPKVFGLTIDENSYKVARLWVLTRSFSPGPQGPQNELQKDEWTLFEKHVGTDFHKGCHTMVPILDLLNHHTSPNVAYSYNPDKRAFVITAERSIPSSFEIYDSYGKFSDSHLFAKFGFVNGDGSGHTQASISLFHRMLDLQISEEFSHFSDTDPEPWKRFQAAQRKGLVRYLQYDDGYVECIPGPEAADPDSWKLKELKFQHLVRIANDASRWVLTAGPRQPKSKPVESSQEVITETPPEMDVRTVRLNIMPLVETCRLLSLIHTDYGGEAISLLQQNLDTPNFILERDSDALEYRAFMWYVLGFYNSCLFSGRSARRISH